MWLVKVAHRVASLKLISWPAYENFTAGGKISMLISCTVIVMYLGFRCRVGDQFWFRQSVSSYMVVACVCVSVSEEECHM